LKGVVGCEGQGHRHFHFARLDETDQYNYPEVFGVDTVGTLAENKPPQSVPSMLSRAWHLSKMISIAQLHTQKSVKTETVHYSSDPAIKIRPHIK
jgi:hypothetical protein